MNRTHMSRTWAELTWTLHEQNLHEQNVNENTWAETHDQNLISRTWPEIHDRSRTSAELTRAGQEQNPHERDMGRTWPQFIRAGHEENAHEQDMKGIIRIGYDKSTWDVITDLTNLIDGEFQYPSKGQKYPSQCRNYLVVLFSNVLIVTMRTFFLEHHMARSIYTNLGSKLNSATIFFAAHAF